MSDDGRSVGIERSTSERDGGCNGCTCGTGPEGRAHHAVWIIHLRGCSVRVCRACGAELLKILRQEFR
jgi:hypothetical protein